MLPSRQHAEVTPMVTILSMVVFCYVDSYRSEAWLSIAQKFVETIQSSFASPVQGLFISYNEKNMFAWSQRASYAFSAFSNSRTYAYLYAHTLVERVRLFNCNKAHNQGFLALKLIIICISREFIFVLMVKRIILLLYYDLI